MTSESCDRGDNTDCKILLVLCGWLRNFREFAMWSMDMWRSFSACVRYSLLQRTVLEVRMTIQRLFYLCPRVEYGLYKEFSRINHCWDWTCTILAILRRCKTTFVKLKERLVKLSTFVVAVAPVLITLQCEWYCSFSRCTKESKQQL